jgi:hypothetical protein
MDKMTAYNDLVEFFRNNSEFKGVEVAIIPPNEEFECYFEDGFVEFKYKDLLYIQEYSDVYETPTHSITYSVCIINDRGDGIVFITNIKTK